MKFLDCFCGLGGASEGFHREGFDCTGIDIVNVGYPYKFILADMQTLDGKDFQGCDVIWGSPPCRHWSDMARVYGSKWKEKPNPEEGMKLVNAFLDFVERAQPSFWIMENTDGLLKYFKEKPRIITYLSCGSNNQGKRHAFWGNFNAFLMPKLIREQMTRGEYKKGIRWPEPHFKNRGKLQPWIHAKIPLACSQAFARACKEALLVKETQ